MLKKSAFGTSLLSYKKIKFLVFEISCRKITITTVVARWTKQNGSDSKCLNFEADSDCEIQQNDAIPIESNI